MEPPSETGTSESLRVGDVMTTDVATATATTPMATVADLMIRRGLRAVPVVNESLAVVGLVTDRHVMDHFLSRVGGRGEGRLSHREGEIGRAPARELMDRSVMCVSHDQAVAEVAALMINKDIERFPVVAEGSLVGFLTRGDILRRTLAPRAPVDDETERSSD